MYVYTHLLIFLSVRLCIIRAVGGMAPLSNYLSGCSLTKLNLQSNYVSNDGAELLGVAIQGR